MLENKYFLIDIDKDFGNIIKIHDKVSGVDFITEPKISENFRFLIPTDKMEANYIIGKKQPISEIIKNENKVILKWEGPFINNQGRFDLKVSETIELKDDLINFNVEVNNNTKYFLAEAWHSFLGGITGFGKREDSSTMVPFWGWSEFEDFFKRFPEIMETGDGAGMKFPEFYCSYPYKLPMPWIDIYNTELNRGAYFACHDTFTRIHVLRAELQPGIIRNRFGGNWPNKKEIKKDEELFPQGVLLNWVNLPYTKPGDVFKGPKVILKFHKGDWHNGAKIYQKWFTSNFKVKKFKSGDWLHKEQAVQISALLLPEGNILHRYKDIPGLARDAKDYGVNTILLVGWNKGGWDRGYPEYSPDPRLGTFADLEDSINKCHNIGVKVVMFANLQPVDSNTEIYKKELYKYKIVNSKGMPNIQGWGMGTFGARMGYTKTPLVYCDVSFPEFRKILINHFKKLAEIGIDGLHLDKVNFWPEFSMDFNKLLEDHGPDNVQLHGLLETMDEIIKSCREINPDFCVSVEAWWDRLLTYSDGWWNWHDMLDHVPVMKYTFPEYLPNFTINQPWDYNEVNNAIRYGYHLLIGPIRFSESMKNRQFEKLAEYIRELISIRETLKDTIFYGDFLDVLEVKVKASDTVKFNTHKNRSTNKRACVLVNFDKNTQEASLEFTGLGSRSAKVYQPFKKPFQIKPPYKIKIPSERLIIVAEE